MFLLKKYSSNAWNDKIVKTIFKGGFKELKSKIMFKIVLFLFEKSGLEIVYLINLEIGQVFKV